MYKEFKEKYCHLIDEFVKSLDTFNAAGIPAIHIPIIGNQYEKAQTKIAFFGIDTYGWHSFQEFMEKYAESTEKAFEYLTKSTKPINYLEWTNNFKTSFWDYIFKFLTTYYELPNPIFTDNKEHKDLLESFIWGNTNSLERYGVTSEGQGALYDDWAHIKESSKIFDTASYVIDICKPDIMIILNWSTGIDENWLIRNDKIANIELAPYHWYYKIWNTNVYWLPHPRFTSSNPKGIGFEKSIELIINDYKGRKNSI